jgi:hypothetical protein
VANYLDTAIAAAIAQGLTPAGASALTQSQVFTLAGVTQNKLPVDFVWEGVRSEVADALQANIDGQAGNALMSAVASAILALQPQPLLYQSALKMLKVFISPQMFPAAQQALASQGVQL